MAESTDQRIKNILQKKAKEKEVAEQAKKQAQERSNERQATAENVRKKWSADTHIIAEILKDFEQKMSALGKYLRQQGTQIGVLAPLVGSADLLDPASSVDAGKV
jgi:tetrahydromethanopterin S-methyltransferase subunit A